MATGGINIYASRRGHYAQCEWWKPTEGAPVRDLEHLGKPSGIFYAKPASTHFDSDNEVDGAFMFDNNTLTIKTTDKVDGLVPHSVVSYEGKIWLVADVQMKPILRTSEYARSADFITYMRLEA